MRYIRLLLALVLTIPAAAQTGRDPGSRQMTGVEAVSVLSSVSVSDVDRSVAWYGEHLGFEVVRKLDFPPDVRIRFVKNGKLVLELSELKGSASFESLKTRLPSLKDRAGLQGFYKLGFYVPDATTLAGNLSLEKVEFVYELTIEKGSGDRWFIIRDPDGNLIQFNETATRKD